MDCVHDWRRLPDPVRKGREEKLRNEANLQLSTLFSNNWLAQNEAEFQAGQWSNARLEPRIAP